MAGAARRPDDDEPLSVEELLRETGAKARARSTNADDLQATSVLAREPVEPLDPDEHRARLERQAREAAYQQQRAGTMFRRIAVATGATVVVGGLILVGVTSETRPLNARTLQVVPTLQPAAPTPTVSTHLSTPQAQAAPPAPGTMSGTQTQPSTRPSAVKPPPPAARATCTVSYVVQDQWDTGFGAEVTITNTGNATISPWSLSWTYTAGQRVTQGWDGNYSQSGSRVTVTAASYNADIAPGDSVRTGFNGALSGANPAPVRFTLDGGTCAAG